jgi:hypothetical protein
LKKAYDKLVAEKERAGALAGGHFKLSQNFGVLSTRRL